ncbi:MAG: hypothetical protein AAB131_08520 [Actinomycetota bacterium]|jgi:hypothetical protein
MKITVRSYSDNPPSEIDQALPAFALVLAVEVALVTISLADPIDSTIVRWLALSVAVMALALPRLLARQADDPVHIPPS